MLAAGTELVAAREAEARARFALVMDLVDDPELHGLLTERAPVRPLLLARATESLRTLGVAEPERRAVDLLAVLDGLVLHRVVGAGRRGPRADVVDVVTAYLTGLVAASQG